MKFTMSFEFCTGSMPDQDFATAEEAADAALDWAIGSVTSETGCEVRGGRSWCASKEEVMGVLERGGELVVDITAPGCRESVAKVCRIGE